MVHKFFVVTVISGTILFAAIYLEEIKPNNFQCVVEFVDTYLMKLTLGLVNSSILSLRNTLGFKAHTTPAPEKLFTAEELKRFNGESGSKGLYLSIIGKVYDVEKGKKHYGPGGNYHYFTGRDGSKAFITGDFSGSDAADDVLSLELEEIFNLNYWLNFYETEYSYKGKLIGRYYDSNGDPTDYLNRLMKTLEEANEKKRKSEDDERKYPPCNSEWNRESGTKVWCSKLSGGIKRDWVGVPRMLYSPGSESYRCACIEDPNDLRVKRNIREYPGCHPQSASCKVDT